MSDETIASMVVLEVIHTAQLSDEVRDEVRTLLELVFAGEFTDDDWEHSLGGMHVIARYEDLVIGHASLVQRRLLYRHVPLRSGYVEGVGVHPDWQGRGIGGAVMDAIEDMVFAAYDLGALGASDEAAEFYARRGWVQWEGPTAVLAPEGIIPTPEEDGGIYVLFVPHLRFDATRELTCDYRLGDVW